MRTLLRSSSCIAAIAALAFILAACAPAPIYKTAPATVATTPQQAAAAPQAHYGQQVVWGGSVVAVHNLADHSEIEVLAYPLDSSQRPRTQKPALGRFIASVAGFVEPMDYPPGAPITLRGTLDGARDGTVGQAPYTFALLHSDAMHRWTAEEMRQGHPNISVGIGVGGWVH